MFPNSVCSGSVTVSCLGLVCYEVDRKSLFQSLTIGFFYHFIELQNQKYITLHRCCITMKSPILPTICRFMCAVVSQQVTCSDLLLAQCVSVKVYRALCPDQRAAVHTRFGCAPTDCSRAGDLFHLSAQQMLQQDISVFQLQQMPPFIYGDPQSKV